MFTAINQGGGAVPRKYTVRLKVGNTTQSESFNLVKDPRSKATQADLEAQFAFLTKVGDETSKANDAVKLVRNIRAQIADRLTKLPEGKRDSFRVSSAALTEVLGQSDMAIYQTKNRSGQDPLNYPIRLNNKIAALAGVASSTDARPTESNYPGVQYSVENNLPVNFKRISKGNCPTICRHLNHELCNKRMFPPIY